MKLLNLKRHRKWKGPIDMEKLGTMSSKNSSGQLEELFLHIQIGNKDNNSKKFLESTQILIKKDPLKN